MIRINYRGNFYNGDHISFNEPCNGKFQLKVETSEEGENGPEKVWKPVFEGATKHLIAVFSVSLEEAKLQRKAYISLAQIMRKVSSSLK